MKITAYEHQGGFAALSVTLRQEIENAVATCAIAPARGAASRIGDAIMATLNKNLMYIIKAVVVLIVLEFYVLVMEV